MMQREKEKRADWEGGGDIEEEEGENATYK